MGRSFELKSKLVFDDWQENGESIYLTAKGIELTFGSFHHGTTFDGEITVNQENDCLWLCAWVAIL